MHAAQISTILSGRGDVLHVAFMSSVTRACPGMLLATVLCSDVTTAVQAVRPEVPQCATHARRHCKDCRRRLGKGPHSGESPTHKTVYSATMVRDFPARIQHDSHALTAACGFEGYLSAVYLLFDPVGQGYVSKLEEVAGTFAWAAPELLMGGRCSDKVDIYSFGVVLWELATCERPQRGQLRDVRCLLLPASNFSRNPHICNPYICTPADCTSVTCTPACPAFRPRMCRRRHGMAMHKCAYALPCCALSSATPMAQVTRCSPTSSSSFWS